MQSLAPLSGSESLRLAVVYTRVSTEEQAEHGTSLAHQRRLCQEFARIRGFHVTQVVEDAGISGSTIEGRPGMAALYARIQKGEVTCLIVSKLDRIGRKLRPILDIAEALEKHGGAIITCDGMELGGSPMGKFLLHSMASIAELERDMIRERCTAGRASKAALGFQPSRSRVPYGFHIPTRREVIAGEWPADLLGRYVVVPDQAAIVRQIFEGYASGQSLRAVAATLLSQGIRSPRGSNWLPGALGRLLAHTAYRGEAFYHPRGRKGAGKERIVIECPAIVPRELWDTCQRRLVLNVARSGPGNRKHLLSGLVICPRCGRRCAARTLRGRPRKNGEMPSPKVDYWCTGAHQIPPTCDSKSHWAQSILVAALKQTLSFLYERPSATQDAFHALERTQAQQGDQTGAAERMEADLKKVERERLNAMRLAAGDLSLAEDWATIIGDLRTRELELQQAIEAIQRPKGIDTSRSAALFAMRFSAIPLEQLDDPETPLPLRNRLVSTLIDRIIPGRDEIRFEFDVEGTVTSVSSVASYRAFLTGPRQEPRIFSVSDQIPNRPIIRNGMNPRTTRSAQRGFTLFEVVLALAIFSAMIVMVGAIVPITAQAVRYSTDFNQAQTVVMRKIAQLQEAGYTNMDAPSLGQNGLDIVDGTPSSPATNANGDQTATFEFTTCDNIWRFFPGGANPDGTQNTTSANRPRGYIFLEPYTPSAIAGSSPTVYGVIKATVVIQWWGWGSRSRMHSYAASTLISRTTVL